LSASLSCMPSRPFELICAFAEPLPNSAERQQSRGMNLFLLDLNIGFNVLIDAARRGVILSDIVTPFCVSTERVLFTDQIVDGLRRRKMPPANVRNLSAAA
jgi:hypothetical protein